MLFRFKTLQHLKNFTRSSGRLELGVKNTRAKGKSLPTCVIMGLTLHLQFDKLKDVKTFGHHNGRQDYETFLLVQLVGIARECKGTGAPPGRELKVF